MINNNLTHKIKRSGYTPRFKAESYRIAIRLHIDSPVWINRLTVKEKLELIKKVVKNYLTN